MRLSDVKSFFQAARFQMRANRNLLDAAWHNPPFQTGDREITAD